MKTYKLKHKPTGLFFCPSRFILMKSKDKTQRAWVKSNLSNNGKVYTIKPSLTWIKKFGFYNHFISEFAISGFNLRQKPSPIIDSDWEIVEV